MTVSRDVNRIEAFSDAVFGFALTLLVVSLEVPRTYAGLLPSRLGIPGSGPIYALIGPAHFIYHRVVVPRWMPAVSSAPGRSI